MIPSVVVLIFEVTLCVSILLCLLRAARGPAAADRMVAIDLLCLLVALLMLAHAVRMKDEFVVDVVLVFAVVAFFGSVALAHYLQREADEPTGTE